MLILQEFTVIVKAGGGSETGGNQQLPASPRATGGFWDCSVPRAATRVRLDERWL